MDSPITDNAALMDLDSSLDMDVDAMPPGAAAELNTRTTKGLQYSLEQPGDPASLTTAVTGPLEGPGPAEAAAFESRADPGVASTVWHTRPDGTVDLPLSAAVMDDADDPGEDDVDMLQVDDEEIDDDVTAVGGDIMGVGPTWGTLAGDPTSNLGRLGPELLQQVVGDDDSPAPAAAAAGGGGGGLGSSGGYTRSDEQPSLVFPSSATAGAADAGGGGGGGGGMESGGGVGSAAAAAGSDGGTGSSVVADALGVTGGHLSEGDADVRGIVGQVVHEDADDLPLGFQRAGVAADSAALGPDDSAALGPDDVEDDGPGLGDGSEGGGVAVGRVGQLGHADTAPPATAAAAEGDDGEGDGPAATAAAAAAADDDDDADADVAGEYGPHEVDGLEAGDIQEGDFVPTSYVRHRSQGHTGIDPDPRNRRDPDPAGGLRSLLETTPDAAVTVAAIDGTLPSAAAASTGAAGMPTEGGGEGAGAAAAAAAAAATAAVGVLGSVLGDVDGSSSHPVHKDDFAMGGLAMPALTDNAVLVTDYTEEPKYAAEVPQQQPGPAERSTDTARKIQAGADTPSATTAEAAAPAGEDESSGVPAGSGQPQMLAVGQGVGPAAVGMQQQKRASQDARHLDAIFAPPSS